MKFRLILGVPLLALGLLLWRCAWETTAPVVEPVSAVSEPTPAQGDLTTSFPTTVEGTIVRPKTTADLRAWFSTAKGLQLPRVFVEKLPDDFAEKGNPELFIQVMAALILRENEQALRERIVLIDLNRKHAAGIPWSESETLFFQGLVEKYDAVAERHINSQIADLMLKVDAIPVAMGVTQAALSTDWGVKDLAHPFHQEGWLDTKTYDFLPFESLIDATHSYVREINGIPTLFEWRASREQFRELTPRNNGYRFLAGLHTYMPWDDTYVDRLRATAEEMEVEAVDALTFLPPETPISFAVGQTVIKTAQGDHVFQTELAETPEQRKRGLMLRTELGADSGMVFINDSSRQTGLWMKNTLIPLDMVFFDEQGVITDIVENAQPHDETVRMSSVPVKGVVELPAGTVQQLAIQKGNTVVVRP